jgi:hypothetical protein
MLRFLRSVLLGIVIANLTPYALAFASYGTAAAGSALPPIGVVSS